MAEAFEATVYCWYTLVNTGNVRKNHHPSRNFFLHSYIITMSSDPHHPHPGSTRTSCKRQIPLDDNGEPVTIPASKKRKVLPPAQPTAASTSKKTTTAQLEPLNKNSTKSLPDNKGKRRQSVDIEDVPDENDQVPSNPPRNPGSILELVSDDGESPPAGSGGESEVIEVLEESEEDEEAELCEILLYTIKRCSPNTFQHACLKNGPRPFMCFSSQLQRLNTRTADAVMYLNAWLEAAKERILAMSAASSTRVMPTQQGIFSGMQGLAGVLK